MKVGNIITARHDNRHTGFIVKINGRKKTFTMAWFWGYSRMDLLENSKGYIQSCYKITTDIFV